MAMDQEQVERGRAGWVRLGQVGEVPQELTQRIRAEYLEMPGLTLTLWQAMRLWNLDARVCLAVLDRLVQSGFLTETRHGAFRRMGG
jgi:hypothetical protein